MSLGLRVEPWWDLGESHATTSKAVDAARNKALTASDGGAMDASCTPVAPKEEIKIMNSSCQLAFTFAVWTILSLRR